jgi:hypothetical protein
MSSTLKKDPQVQIKHGYFALWQPLEKAQMLQTEHKMGI